MSVAEPRYLIAHIQAQYTSLPPAEQRVASYVLEHPAEVIDLSVTQLADAVGVADATVTRFCRSIELRGYQELRLRLAQDTARGVAGPTPVSSRASANELSGGPPALTRKLTDMTVQTMESTLQVLDLTSLDAAAEAICRAERVRIFGMGESWPLCYATQVRLLGLGKAAEAPVDSHVQAMSAALVGQGDVAFGISHMGATKDVVESLRTAKANGATTICLTAQGRSPVTAVSDIRLIVITKDVRFDGWTLRSKVSQVLALDLLITLVALKLQGDAWKSNERATEAILDKLY